jgi:F-type H+-transporting ATPase subunit a
MTHGTDLFGTEQWLIPAGVEHPFFYLNIHTILYTWITLGIIAALLFWGRYFLTKKDSLGKFITISFVQFFMDLLKQSLPFSFGHFVFITTTFCFVLACNLISIVPGIEEPTKDLNTTLALGLVAFIYTQVAAIQAMGLGNYVKGYFSPFFVMLPLNIVGKLASVVSLSFRLFGNIFGGAIISSIYFSAIKGNLFLEFLGLISGLNLSVTIFFGIFEGFLQAFVFSMLALTYLSIAVHGEGGH